MAELVTTQALIIAVKDFKESDLRVVFLSQDFGLRDAVATGAKKSVSKQRSRLEPGVITQLSFAKGRRFDRVTTSEPLFVPNKTRMSLKKLTSLQFLLGCIKETTKVGDESAQLYLMASKAVVALENIEEGKIDLWNKVVAERILELAGFEPVEKKPLQRQMEYHFEKRIRSWEILNLVKN